MSRFATDQDVYEHLGGLLSTAAADEGAAARLQQADAVVQYRLTEPDATLTLDARKASTVAAEFGDTKLEPELVLSLAADTAHDLFTGDLNLTAALASGEIATKGSVTKILRLLPVNLTLAAVPEEVGASTGASDPNGADEPTDEAQSTEPTSAGEEPNPEPAGETPAEAS